MRKFKLIFYPLYVIIALGVLYFSVDILVNTDSYKAKVDFGMLRTLPYYVVTLTLIMSVLMVIEFGVDIFDKVGLKNRLKKAEQEILELKARLYDESQQEEAAEQTDEYEIDEDK